MKINIIVKFLVMALIISGCSKRPPSDDEARTTAKNFWNAFATGDQQGAKKHVRKATDLSLFESTSEDSANSEYSFDNLRKQEDFVILETTVSRDGEIALPINTVLVEEDGIWKVDYERTMESLLDLAFNYTDDIGLSVDTEIEEEEDDDDSEYETTDTELVYTTEVSARQYVVKGFVTYQGKKLNLESALITSVKSNSIGLSLFPYGLTEEDIELIELNPAGGEVMMAWDKQTPNAKFWSDWSPYITMTISFQKRAADYSKDRIAAYTMNLNWWKKRNTGESFSYQGKNSASHFAAFTFLPNEPPTVEFLLNYDDSESEKGGPEFEIRMTKEKTKRRVEKPITETAALPENLKNLARERYEREVAKIPKFDRHSAVKKILLEEYNINLDLVSIELRTKADVEDLIDQLAEEKASRKFTRTRKAKLIAQAEKEFPLYQPGDVITVKTLRGSVKGVLKGISEKKIKVERFPILKSDIVSPDPACFDKARCLKRREHFLRVNFDVPKDDYTAKIRKKLIRKTYKEQGFIVVNKKWVSANTIIRNEIDPVVDEIEEKYTTEFEKRIKRSVEKQLRLEGLIE